MTAGGGRRAAAASSLGRLVRRRLAGSSTGEPAGGEGMGSGFRGGDGGWRGSQVLRDPRSVRGPSRGVRGWPASRAVEQRRARRGRVRSTVMGHGQTNWLWSRGTKAGDHTGPHTGKTKVTPGPVHALLVR